MGALVLHKSSVSGLHLRDDPTIMAWEIANNPVCPGDDSGDVLQVSRFRARELGARPRRMTGAQILHNLQFARPTVQLLVGRTLARWLYHCPPLPA